MENLPDTQTEGYPDEEGLDVSPFLEYLKTDKGHELASRVVNIVEDVKKVTLEKTVSHAKFEKILQATIIIVVVIAASLLTYFGKFETSVGILFGSLVGYVFGKNQNY